MIKPLQFTVNRPPVSTNKKYATTKSGGFYVKKESKEFQQAVKDAAFAAVQKHGSWPKPEDVKQVYLEIIVFNTRHDCSAAEKDVADALEGIVYKNDKVAHPRFNEISSDGGLKRVQVMVKLLESKDYRWYGG